jgi:hypothetical protein
LPVAFVRFVSASLLALALAACNPATDEKTAGADTPTPRNPFFGTWELVHASIAPWWQGPGEEPAPDMAMTKFTLAADKTAGAPLLTCGKPTYATNLMPQRSLFQGNLPDPAANAAALGFTSSDVTVLTYSCSENNADVSLNFAMLDDERITLALDNVIYTFRRTGS